MGKLFGTDGIRGIVGENLTADLAYRVGQAVTHVLFEEKGSKPLITIGMDTRISSDIFSDMIFAEIALFASDGNLTRCFVFTQVKPKPISL